MNVEKAFVGARGVDSLPFSQGGTAAQAKRLKETGIDFFVGYLGSLNKTRLQYLLDAGLAVMFVTFAGEYFDGPADELAHLKALGVPPGATVWLDLEGQKSFHWQPQDLILKINTWAKAVQKAGYVAGLYVGSPQPLTGDELARLAVTRYWKVASRVLDRHGRAWDEPPGVGFCAIQTTERFWPNDTDPNRVWVDVDFIYPDRRERLPTWVRG